MNKILQDLDDASHRSCSPPEPGICNGGGAPAARFSSAHVTMRKTMKMVMVMVIMEMVIMVMKMVIMIMKMVTTRPFYPPAGLHRLGANHCPGFGPAPQSGIWSKHYLLGKLTQELAKLGTTTTMNNHLLKDKNTNKNTL